MTIRNAKNGDIVYLHYGYGPKAEVVDRRDLRNLKPRAVAGIYYTCKLLEPYSHLSVGDTTDQRARSLMRKRAVEGN